MLYSGREARIDRVRTEVQPLGSDPKTSPDPHGSLCGHSYTGRKVPHQLWTWHHEHNQAQALLLLPLRGSHCPTVSGQAQVSDQAPFYTSQV